MFALMGLEIHLPGAHLFFVCELLLQTRECWWGLEKEGGLVGSCSMLCVGGTWFIGPLPCYIALAKGKEKQGIQVCFCLNMTFNSNHSCIIYFRDTAVWSSFFSVCDLPLQMCKIWGVEVELVCNVHLVFDGTWFMGPSLPRQKDLAKERKNKGFRSAFAQHDL